jgi:hypothetical protein
MSSSSCVAYVASFSGLSIFDWPENIDPKPGMSHYIPCHQQNEYSYLTLTH